MTNQRKARLVKKGTTTEQPAASTTNDVARVDMRMEVLKKVEKRGSAGTEARAMWRTLFN